MATTFSTAAPEAPVNANLTDEAILGITDDAAISLLEVSPHDDFADETPDAHTSFGRVRVPANTRVAPACPEPGRRASVPAQSTSEAAGRDAGATQSTADAQGSGESATASAAPQNNAAPIPEWLAQISASSPNAAPELANLWQRSTALETFDRAFYGADASAQQQLIAQLYSDDPAALRAMVAAAAQLLDAPARENSPRAANAFVARARIVGAGPFDAASTPPIGTSPSANDQTSSGNHLADHPNIAQGNENPRPYETERATNSNDAAQNNPAQSFNPAAFAQFEQSTNDAVVSDVSRAIDRALDRALPAGIADGARRRIASDTLAEVHTALRGDRQLASQVAAILRGSLVAPASVPAPSHFQNADRDALRPDSGLAGATQPDSHAARFDNAARDAVARLISSRARGVVPEAARRVISEWTGSVLSAHRERSARQQSAAARVDVMGSQSPGPVQRPAVKPRDINYRATSDEDILSW